jgi:hypothetical protein
MSIVGPTRCTTYTTIGIFCAYYVGCLLPGLDLPAYIICTKYTNCCVCSASWRCANRARNMQRLLIHNKLKIKSAYCCSHYTDRITWIWYTGYEMWTNTLINRPPKQPTGRVAFLCPYTSVTLDGPCSRVPRRKYETGIGCKVPRPMGGFKANSHTLCRFHAPPMPFPCHAAPLRV